jgi:WD40 repeat protein
VWDLAGGIELLTLTGHNGFVNAVTVSSDGRAAISASDDHTLKVWDISTGQELRTLAGHGREVRSVTMFPGIDYAVSASDDYTVKVWDVMSGQCLATFTTDGIVWSVVVVPGKNLIIAGDDLGQVHFLRIEGLRLDSLNKNSGQ